MQLQTDLTKRFIETHREVLADAQAKGSKFVRVPVADLAIMLDLGDYQAHRVDAIVSAAINRVLSIVADEGGLASIVGQESEA